MALTLLHPTPVDIPSQPPVFSDEWHRQQYIEERAWLDTYNLDPTIANALRKATR